jgi:hypothetical protein
VALVDTRWVRRRVYHLQAFVAVNQSIALDDSVRHRVADGELAVVARVVAQHNRGGHRARVRRAAIVSSTHREAADATSIDTVRCDRRSARPFSCLVLVTSVPSLS